MYETTLLGLLHARYMREKLKFREQVLPFTVETTIGILITLFIYSCVTNVTGNYICETSNKLRSRLNNHIKGITYNSRAIPVAVHFKQPDHLLRNMRCLIF